MSVSRFLFDCSTIAWRVSFIGRFLNETSRCETRLLPLVILPTGEERSQALAVRDEFGKNDMSDHLMLLRAFDAYSAAGQKQWQFCRKKFLSPNTMKMIVGIRSVFLFALI